MNKLLHERIKHIPWRGIPSWLAGNRLRILMYHSIADKPQDPHAISPQTLRKQMQALQAKQVISLQDALGYLNQGVSLKNVFVITFDDALLDFYAQALPVLSEFHYPVTMFVPTGLVGKKAVWDSYDKSKPLMTWQQLEACQQHHVYFGSHTVNHVRLTECDDETMMYELSTSLNTLQERLENFIPALAYPGGYHNEHVRAVVSQAGFECAVGSSSRWGNGPETDRYQLRRERFDL